MVAGLKSRDRRSARALARSGPQSRRDAEQAIFEDHGGLHVSSAPMGVTRLAALRPKDQRSNQTDRSRGIFSASLRSLPSKVPATRSPTCTLGRCHVTGRVAETQSKEFSKIMAAFASLQRRWASRAWQRYARMITEATRPTRSKDLLCVSASLRLVITRDQDPHMHARALPRTGRRDAETQSKAIFEDHGGHRVCSGPMGVTRLAALRPNDQRSNQTRQDPKVFSASLRLCGL